MSATTTKVHAIHIKSVKNSTGTFAC